MCFLLLRALSATTQLPVTGGAPLMPHAWRLLPACPPREPYAAGLRAACLHLSSPWAGQKHQHKHCSTAGAHEAVASCSGKGRDQESRSDKPPWGHQSSPRHFVTARRSLRGPGKGPGQTGSARCLAAATFPGMHFPHPEKQGCVQKDSVNGLPVEATRFLVSLGCKSPDGDVPVASILQELLWFGS